MPSVEHRGEVIIARAPGVRGARAWSRSPTAPSSSTGGGKIHTGLNMPLKTRDDLSMAYTPGVARVCTAIAENRQKAFKYTIKANTVAVVSDGTAVLGLGDIGPEAAMPVMEGKAMLFKEFADVDAFPICLDTKDPDEIVETVKRDRPHVRRHQPRGHLLAALLRDRAAPDQAELDIPVFHDDQHGTAIVVLAALINACRLTGRRIEDLPVCDGRRRRRRRGRGEDPDGRRASPRSSPATASARSTPAATTTAGLDERAQALARREHEPRAAATARPREVLEGTDLFIGLSGPGHHRRDGPRADEPGPVRLRDGQPQPRGARPRRRRRTCG